MSKSPLFALLLNLLALRPDSSFAQCGPFLSLREPPARNRYVVRLAPGNRVEAVSFDRARRLVFVDHAGETFDWIPASDLVQTDLLRIFLPFLTTTAPPTPACSTWRDNSQARGALGSFA